MSEGETLGATANDANDADAGANNLQNFPLLTSIITANSSTTFQGTLNSTRTGNITAALGSIVLTKPLSVQPSTTSHTLTLTPTTARGGTSVTANVVLRCAASPGGVTVTFSTSNSALASPSTASIVIPEGETTGNVQLNTSPVTVATFVSVRALIGRTTKTATLRLTP
ncbi:MAG: hypothetical protein MSG64_19025 [Pyrinomonadaceae bacterium MAG19_C2-C3]|nr:hypothetical protein [Pyrinomonadaceae bacterium MAG19_C2-C3]